MMRLLVAVAVPSLCLSFGYFKEEVCSEAEYIVIGGGSAGAIVATKLAKAGSCVTLIEAGPDDRDYRGDGAPLDVAVPVNWAGLSAAAPEIIHASWTAPVWETERPYDFTAKADLGYPISDFAEQEYSGKILGGSSSVNAMVYIRGADAIYDRWGSDRWNSSVLLPKWEALEEELGPRSTSLMTPAATAWVDAAYEEFGFLEISEEDCAADIANIGQDAAGFCRGISRSISAENGERLSTAYTFLTDEVRALPNLKILVSTRVLTLQFYDKSAASPRIIGVVVKSDAEENEYYIGASREVIVSAGAKLSPQLLLISGIGPAAELEAVGVSPIVDSPGVGKNLTSHVAAFIFLPVKQPDFGIVPCCFTPTTSLVDFMTFFSSDICKQTNCGLADISVVFANLPAFVAASPEELARLGALPFGVVAAGVSRFTGSKARGEVILKSSDPYDWPLVDPNYRGDPEDVIIMKEAIEKVMAVANAANDTFGEGLRFPFQNSTLEETIERTSQTYWHPLTTNRMGDDINAVVDFDLKVYGVRGLRVIDNSIAPIMPNANTNPCAMIIGFHGADIILEEENPIAQCPTACHPLVEGDASAYDCSAC